METRAAETITENKTYTYTASNGDVEWKAILRGTFSYTGSSSNCSASSCDVTINNSSWYVVSKTVGQTGATASADVTIGLKLWGITTKKVPINIHLTCDADGYLS